MDKWSLAQRRFGLGVRLGEKPSPYKFASAQDWLIDQLNQELEYTPQRRSYEVFQETFLQHRKAATTVPAKAKQRLLREYFQTSKRHRVELAEAVLLKQISSKQPLQWRLFDFFSNHFYVDNLNSHMARIAGHLEIETIAPNLHRKFDDLLISAVTHPAMLYYLDNTKSIARQSPHGKKRPELRIDINENLAREILELHTLGIDGGYNLEDIQSLAHALAGYSTCAKTTRSSCAKQDSIAIFHSKYHEPQPRRLLGKTYPVEAQGHQAISMLRDLAKHPQTANFVCQKLCEYFISHHRKDTRDIHREMVDAWLASDGRVSEVMSAMILHPQSWQAKRRKYQTPRQYLISCYRALAIDPSIIEPGEIYNTLANMGQQPHGMGAPTGYPSNNDSWNGPNALLNRIRWTAQLTERYKTQLPTLNDNRISKLCGGMNKQTLTQLVNTPSTSRQAALTLLTLQFMWR